MRLGRNGSVVPFGEEFVEQDWQGGFEVVSDLAAGFVGAADDVDGGFESGGGRGVAHQAGDAVSSVSNRTPWQARPTCGKKRRSIGLYFEQSLGS